MFAVLGRDVHGHTALAVHLVGAARCLPTTGSSRRPEQWGSPLSAVRSVARFARVRDRRSLRSGIDRQLASLARPSGPSPKNRRDTHTDRRMPIGPLRAGPFPKRESATGGYTDAALILSWTHPGLGEIHDIQPTGICIYIGVTSLGFRRSNLIISNLKRDGHRTVPCVDPVLKERLTAPSSRAAPHRVTRGRQERGNPQNRE